MSNGEPLDLEAIKARAADCAKYPFRVDAQSLQLSKVDVPDLLAELDRLRRELAEASALLADVDGNPTELAKLCDQLRAKLDMPCGSCHPCTNWADETWRRADRKPPDVQLWDDTLAEVESLRRQVSEARDQTGEFRRVPGCTCDYITNVGDHHRPKCALTAELDVIEAARAWRANYKSPYGAAFEDDTALVAAVDALDSGTKP